jgi:hypothetical protein
MALDVAYPFKNPKPFADPRITPAYPCSFAGCRHTETNRDQMLNHIIDIHMRHGRDNYLSARRAYDRIATAREAQRLQPNEITRLTPPNPGTKGRIPGFQPRKVA